MQDLLVDFITSLDGYGAAEGWPGWWGLEGPEYLAWLGQQPERDYTILMGANTYRLMSGFATESKTSASDEPMTDEGAAIAELARASKVVFSSTLQPPLSWPNTRLISGDAVQAVAALKQDGTSPMRTLGSLTLCRSLLEAGLVDRFRVVVFPVITGSTGRDRIYDGYPDVTLEMVAGRTLTADSSCSSMSPRCSLVHPARTRLPERGLLSEPRDVRVEITLAGDSLHEDDTRRGLKKEWARQTGWAWVMRPDPTPHAPSSRCRPASARRRLLPTRTATLGGWARPPPRSEGKAGQETWSLSDSTILPVFSTRRRTGIEPARELSPPHRF
jgi:dihydrofolate reductase